MTGIGYRTNQTWKYSNHAQRYPTFLDNHIIIKDIPSLSPLKVMDTTSPLTSSEKGTYAIS